MIKLYYIRNNVKKKYIYELLKELKNNSNVLKINFNFLYNEVKIRYKKNSNVASIEQIMITRLKEINSSFSIINKMNIVNTKKFDIYCCLAGISICLINYFFIPENYKYIIYLLIFMITSKPIFKDVLDNFFKKNYLNEKILLLFSLNGIFWLGHHTECIFIIGLYVFANFSNYKIIKTIKNSILKIVYSEIIFLCKIEKSFIVPTPINRIKSGDTILVKPGEVIFLDGMVVEGSSDIDDNSLSSFVINKDIDKKKVYAGCSLVKGSINLTNPIYITIKEEYATKSNIDTFTKKIEEIIDEKPKFVRKIQFIQKIYLISILILSTIVFLTGFFINGFSLYDIKFLDKGLAIIALSCSWLFYLAVPLAYKYTLVIGRTFGYFIKDLDTIDKLGKIKTLFLSKAGILTSDKLEILNVIPYKNYSKEIVLFYAAIAENNSNHPIAKSIKTACKDKNIDFLKLVKITEKEGKGIEVLYDNKNILVGNDKFFEDKNIDYSYEEDINNISVHVAINNEYIGSIVLIEKIKNDSILFIEKLKNLKLKRIVVITGEKTQISRKILKSLNIRNIYGDLSNIEKNIKIKKEQDRFKNKFVGFVDSNIIQKKSKLIFSNINFVFLKNNLEQIINFSDIILLKENLNIIPQSIQLSKNFYNTIRGSVIVNFCIKGIIILFILIIDIKIGFIFISIGIDLIISLFIVNNCFRISKNI